MKILSKNKRANFDYSLLKKYSAGIVLYGNEVKSIKSSNVSLKEAYVRFIKEDLLLINCHVAEYKLANIRKYDPLRSRKLLLTKKELNELRVKINEGGMTIVPTILFEERGLIKLEISLAKGKKKYDKREALKQKTLKRDEKSRNDIRW